MERGRPKVDWGVPANAMKGDRDRCLAAGMDDYLAKPLHKERLRELVSRWSSTHPGREDPAR